MNTIYVHLSIQLNMREYGTALTASTVYMEQTIGLPFAPNPEYSVIYTDKEFRFHRADTYWDHKTQRFEHHCLESFDSIKELKARAKELEKKGWVKYED